MNVLKSLEHGAKDLAFGICRIFFRKGRQSGLTIDPSGISKVLFLRPEKIGDMVISLPVFDALRARFPQVRISVLASPRNYELIKDDPRFDRIFLYRKWTLEDFRQLAAIRRERFDCVVDMIDNDSMTALFFSQLAGSQAIRIGVGKTRHAIFYDFNHCHADGIGEHIIDNTLKLLAPFGINGTASSGSAPPYISTEAKMRATDIVGTIPTGNVTIGFNLSAGKPNRIWPDEHCSDLCRKLMNWRNDIHIIIITAPGDRPRGEKLVVRTGRKISLVPDGLGLIEVSALISRLDLLISPDTSLIHIARAFQVPVVGLYSRASKNFRRWRPYRQADAAVVGGDIDRIRDITVSQVFDRVRQVLKRVEAERK